MKGRRFIKICSLLCLAGAARPRRSGRSLPCRKASNPPRLPYILKAKLNGKRRRVDRLQPVVLHDRSDGYDSQSAEAGVWQSNGIGTTYGGGAAGRFEYQIPCTTRAPAGRRTAGQIACIDGRLQGTQLYLTYPETRAIRARTATARSLCDGD